MSKILEFRGVKLVNACIEKLKKGKNNRKAKPLSEKVLRNFCLPGGKKLPPTLLEFLQYDFTFNSLYSDYDYGPLEYYGTYPFGKNPNKPVFTSLDLRTIAIRWLEQNYKKDFSKLCLTDSSDRSVKDPLVLAHSKPLGDFYPLPYAGDQWHFLYIGAADKRGEYPIIGAEWESSKNEKGEIEGTFFPFLKYPAFDLYLADMINYVDLGNEPLGKIDDFKSEVKNLIKLNPGLVE